MGAMATEAVERESFLPHGRPFSRADLETMPDDGNRYEIIDGVLLVSAAPRPIHQRVSMRLSNAVSGYAPAVWKSSRRRWMSSWPRTQSSSLTS